MWLASVSLASVQPASILERGVELYERGKYRSALAQFQKALRLVEGGSQREKALFYRISAEYKLGRFDRAAEHLISFLKEYPASTCFKKALKRLYDIGVMKVEKPARILWFKIVRSDEGIKLLEEVVALDPSGELADDALYRIARAHYDRGEWESARKKAGELLKRFPRSRWRELALLLRAMCSERATRGPAYDISPAMEGLEDAVRTAATAENETIKKEALNRRKYFLNTLAESEYNKAIMFLRLGKVKPAVAIFRLLQQKHPGSLHSAVASRALELPEMKKLIEEYGERE